MPSREEIVKWLNEAAEHFDSIGDVYKSNSALTIKNKYLEHAAQVEAMRCETCNQWHPTEGLRSDYCTGMKWNEVDKMGPDFGCFSHKPKEERCQIEKI